MRAPRPLFVFGLARSGTNLLARMLDTHPAVAVALDTLLPLFKLSRNILVRERAPATVAARFDPEAPFQDGYADRDGPALLDLLLAGDLALPVAPAEQAQLGKRIAARAGIEEPDLAEPLRGIAGETIKALFDAALATIAARRGGTALRWVGVKEVWVTDHLPALARAYPEARFLLIERDPRAILASLAVMAEKDPTQHAHHVSYLRHWRKTAVLARHYTRDPALRDRVRLVSYEALAADPEAGACALADFLDLPYDPAMLRLDETTDRATGRRWQGNSSYGTGAICDGGITAHSIDRWRGRLPVAAVRTAEFLCGPEMGLTDYPTGGIPAEPGPSVLEYVLTADQNPGSWRSDVGDPVVDFGFELFRHQLLALPANTAPADLVRRAFLFPWVYEAVRGGMEEHP